MKSSIICLLVYAVMGTAFAQVALPVTERPLISVTGEAVVHATPDRILISVGIETWDTGIAAAKKKNNEILTRAVAALRECGIEDKDIQTSHLSLEPRWKDDYRRDDFIGYFARNDLAVTVGDVSGIENVITRVLEAGITRVHGVEFQTSDLKSYREEARALALKAAREKAGKMASVLGKTISNPVRIEERQTGAPSGYLSGWPWGRADGSAQYNVESERGTAEIAPETIAPGRISVRASVSVSFELAD